MLRFVGFVLLLLSLSACKQEKALQQIDLFKIDWKEIQMQAKGSTVHFMMWQGSPAINSYMNDFLIPKVKELYDIELKLVGGQGPEIVQLVMSEKQAGSNSGQVDMSWINGETFFQLRQINGLWGPFVESLPNSQLIDFDNPHISIDFQQPINYMECPWSITQFAMVHDLEKTPNPPANLSELENWIGENPGQFTISNDFSGMTLLKSFFAEISGDKDGLNGAFDEQKYNRLSGQLWEWINRNKKNFWKEGETFPKEQTKMDQLYANGELSLCYGFGEGSIDDKIRQGLFPNTTKVYPWKNGTIRNSNYLGIHYNASNKAGAMVVINYMISPEAQLRKIDPSGMDANTVLDIDKLSDDWKVKFENREKRKYGATIEELAAYAIQEPDPQYMIRLYEDFRKEVIEK